MTLSPIRTSELTVSSIKIIFNDDLDTNIGVANISIYSEIDSISNPEVRSVSVENEQLSITFSPLFPKVKYKILFVSTDTQSFQSINGEPIVEDGGRNSLFIVSPGETQNTIRDNVFSDISSIYDIDGQTTVRSLITTLADELQTSSDAISTTKSGNYLSQQVIDELKIRDDGPVDKLDNGGAFQILRVASTPTGFSKNGTLLFNSTREQTFSSRNGIIINSAVSDLPSDPISLQEIDVINEKVTDNIDLPNYFSGLFVKLSYGPIIRVVSVALKRNGTYTEYDIENFGYTLFTNYYDTSSASTNVNIGNNEFELSSSSLTGNTGGFLTPQAGDELYVSYTYKRLGRNIDGDSIELSRVKNVVREAAPAIVNIFSLDYAPIVNSSGIIFETGGVTFYNTIAYDGHPALTYDHPAFIREIPYNLLHLPEQAGEYSVDYSSGSVIVYGEDETNKGTGLNPPVASYSYKHIFDNTIDYTFDSDNSSLSLNSTREIDGLDATISFNYEDTFAEGTDFRVLSHVEVLNERILNKLTGSFALETQNFPITDVFRIFNETTGEIYSLDRFNDTTVFFNGTQAPRQKDIVRERATFVRVPQEILLISDELSNTIGLTVFKINLENNGIADSHGTFVGANFDTSALFSNADVFVREFFYEDRLFTSVETNIDRLLQVGDYSIDYNNGIIYVAVSASQDSNIGDVTYLHKKIDTSNSNILGVNNIYKSKSALQSNVVNYLIGDISDTEAEVVGLEQIGERFINGTSSRVLVVGAHQNGEDGVTSENIFTSNGAIFTEDDVGRYLTVGSSVQPPVQEVLITGLINIHQVLVSPDFIYSGAGRVWSVVDLSPGSPKTITLDHDIVSVNNIYTVSQLGTLPSSLLDGYFDINRDTVSGNVITLGDDNPLELGAAVVVSYNFGNIFIDYKYLRDNIIISYEYGKNSIDWSISNSLYSGQEYYVTYKYGALRNSLLLNFGSLTQIPQLTNFSPNLNRETYRSVLSGTLQSFIEGPTVRSIERLVESFTGVTPEIEESTFSNWVVGRDKLHLRKPTYLSTQSFDLGRFDKGAIIDSTNFISVPALSHIKINEGTISAWLRPNWSGLANDAQITFDIQMDGYYDESRVFIGFSGFHPDSIPFTLNSSDDDPSVTSVPNVLDSETGYFIWYDEFEKKWNIVWRENSSFNHNFTGTISTDGEFYSVNNYTGLDGYSNNETSDIITSSLDYIKFSGYIDGYDSGYSSDGISFASDLHHYIFDMAASPSANRMSLFKDGSGYLNFQVFDNRGMDIDGFSGFYNVSKDISAWNEDELHHVAVSWRFNSDEENDEMHLFVDGSEVQNLFKYGGNPKASSLYDFGNVSEEVVISSATKPIIGGSDGSTYAGSFVFVSTSSDFSTDGVSIGDSLYLLDDTADGTGSPNYGTPYGITGVGSSSITLDRAPTLTLSSVKFSVNSTTKTVDTHVNIQDFIVVKIDADGNETELAGVDSSDPDYSTVRGTYYNHTLTINNGIAIGDRVVIRPLGLILRRCKDKVYVYGGGYDEIRLNSAPPVSLADVKITSIVLDKTSISEDGYFDFASGIVDAQLVTLLTRTISDMCQPSNQSAGKKLDITFSGDNFNYTLSGNTVVINGTTYSGATTETLSFTESTTTTSSQYWKTIENLTISAIPIDLEKGAGTVEIRESIPITVSENNGDYAEIVDYANGIFRLETYGTGGNPYILNACTYEVDYPSYLRVPFDSIPDKFYIGCDHNESNNLSGTIDEFKILDFMASDTRVGEEVVSGEYSITTDYNSSNESEEDANTLLLMHLNSTVEDSSIFRDRFNAGYEVSSSINSDFGMAIKFGKNNPYIVNDASIFNTDEGSIEFWVSPFQDSIGDPNYRYYVDMTTSVEIEVESVSRVSVISPRSIREVESIRLVSDIYNTGINYFDGGSLSTVDNKTISLSTPLPDYNTPVRIRFVSLDNQGDRVSIFRDPDGRVNFFVKASGVEHLLSVSTVWDRHTWHRIMVMWKTNSSDGQDRLRLFVDGEERGTIRYGTGLIYGTGVIYGQEEIRSGADRFLVDNIDLTDVFSTIYLGSDITSNNGASAKMDNIRFSEIQRLETIKVVSSTTIDVNYYQNTLLAIPVTEDVYTTKIFNFDDDSSNVIYLATVVNKERGIFRFKVKVIDSFDRVIGNTELENLLVTLINTIKAAHCEAIVEYIRW